jgi:hypothetical protein
VQLTAARPAVAARSSHEVEFDGSCALHRHVHNTGQAYSNLTWARR